MTGGRPQPTAQKREEIRAALAGYWERDVWDVFDPVFDSWRPEKWGLTKKTMDFSGFAPGVKKELQFFLSSRLRNRTLRLLTAATYSSCFRRFQAFLAKHYPRIESLTELRLDKARLQWRTYLIERGHLAGDDGRLASGTYESLLLQSVPFLAEFYDDREEFEKLVWDVRKIPGAQLTNTAADHLLHFEWIPGPFRPLAMRYVKARLGRVGYGQCRNDLQALRLFLGYAHKNHPGWTDLRALTRAGMEDYLVWSRGHIERWGKSRCPYLGSLRTFLEYVQRAEWPEAPETPHVALLFQEDFPRQPQRSDEAIRYIPAGVLDQLEEHLAHLRPPEYIPIVVLLRASGWRISDVVNLRYDTCLERTAQGWWLCGDIVKTQVLNHRVPITDEVAALVQAAAKQVASESTPDNNPDKLLFVRLEGRRKGRPPSAMVIRNALNRLAKQCAITDDQGGLFHFRNHAFRHTKGVELINNGMNLLHVQKWMAHASPEMTLRYAKILDDTLRKSWEEATRNGLFRVDPSGGKVTPIVGSQIENEDRIEWEYIRHHLDAVRMPLGYCLKPRRIACKHQLNPCLVCRNLCTTPDFIPQYELEIQQTKLLIERGMAQGRSVWVEKNEALLARLEAILTTLKQHKAHHLAGKKTREYVGEEREHAQT